jgi:threonine dehydratase
MASSETTSPHQAGGAEEIVAVNGINGTAQPHTPPRSTPSRSDLPLARTPSLNSFSLTEYSAKPTAPTEDRKTHMKKIVPDEFLLPNGNPDVSRLDLLFRSHPSMGGVIRDAGTHCGT